VAEKTGCPRIVVRGRLIKSGMTIDVFNRRSNISGVDVIMRSHGLKLSICLLLTVAALAAYWQLLDNNFIHLDDYEYVIENPHVNKGITKQGVRWAFSSFYANNWHPLTWLSHMLDCQLFGLNPGMHHLTNLLFHIGSSIMLFLAFARATGALWRSAFVAALFALHPLHVESVAWVAERKDVLSAFFWIMTIWAYILYLERKGVCRYLMVLLVFALGLMSKQMLVTLPFVLLLMDYWPLGRMDPGQWTAIPGPGISQSGIFQLVREKIPLFALTAGGTVIAFLAQHRGGSVASLEALTLNSRVCNALVSYLAYMVNMIWPSDLAVYYPHTGEYPLWQVAGAGLILFFLSLALLWWGRRLPYLAVGWLWYLGTLLPVIGLIQVGAQAMADRYTYIPLIGLFIIISWVIPDLLQKRKNYRIMLSLPAVIVLSALIICTWLQVRRWSDTITLFTHTLDVTADNWLAHNALGTALKKQGQLESAIAHYSEAIRLRPHYPDAHVNLGVALYSGNMLEQAVWHFSEAIRIEPEHDGAHDNLGVALARQGKTAEALDHLLKALSINPDNAKAHNNLGNTLAIMGRFDEAVRHFREALRINPDYENAKRNLDHTLKRSDAPGSPWRTVP